MKWLKIKTLMYLLITFVSVLSIAYIYFSTTQIQKSTLQALKSESINKAYQVAKQLSELNDKVSFEYNKHDKNLSNSLEVAQKYFTLHGREASLVKLKKQLEEQQPNLIYHIYLINDKYIIKNTTFEPDQNLDFHFVPKALSVLKDIFNHPKKIDISTLYSGMMNSKYKKYIVQKAKNGNYLIQLSFSVNDKVHVDNFIKNIKKQLPTLLNTQLFLLYLNEDQVSLELHWAQGYTSKNKAVRLSQKDTELKFLDTLKENKQWKDKELLLYMNEFVKNANYKDNYYYKKDIYVHQVIMPSFSYLNANQDTVYILSMEFDETEAKNSIDNMQTLSYLIWFVLFSLIGFAIYILNLRIIKPIVMMQSFMKKKEYIDLKLLANKYDEINQMSLVYNKLLQDLNLEIASNQELLGEFKNFTGNTIHQIRTPISVIKIALEMIETIDKDAVLQIRASLISIEHMYDSLSYALHHNGAEFKKEHLNLSVLLQERVALFQTIAQAYDRKIVLNMADDVIVNMNKTEAEYLIDNNLSNAIKYGVSQKEISIKLRKTGEDISLIFESYGEPIKDTKIIFERYQRVEKDRQGHGIGLHMVDAICQNNNIFIKVDYMDKKNKFIYFFDANVT